MRKPQTFSFADAYGLGLIAKNPTDDWKQIRDHLSDDAKKVADEIISPGPASREVKSTAQGLLKLADKVNKFSQT